MKKISLIFTFVFCSMLPITQVSPAMNQAYLATWAGIAAADCISNHHLDAHTMNDLRIQVGSETLAQSIACAFNLFCIVTSVKQKKRPHPITLVSALLQLQVIFDNLTLLNNDKEMNTKLRQILPFRKHLKKEKKWQHLLSLIVPVGAIGLALSKVEHNQLPNLTLLLSSVISIYQQSRIRNILDGKTSLDEASEEHVTHAPQDLPEFSR